MQPAAKPYFIVVVLAVAASASVASALPPASGTAVRAHAAFLASDALEGRDSATRGHAIAALYAAAQFEQYGLRPAGDDGTYFQSVPLRRTRLEEVSVTSGGTTLEWKQDFVARGNPVEPEVALNADVVFAGYGIEAPDLGQHDYAGLDVEGKAVLLLSGAPESFPHAKRAHYSSRRVKAAEAAQRGAVGLLYLRTRTDTQRVAWERISLNADRPGMSVLDVDGSVRDAPPELRFSIRLSEAGAEKLLGAGAVRLDQLLDEAEGGNVQPRPLGIQVDVRLSSAHEDVTSPNVAALLPGADPAHEDEYVVCSAHLDHVGTGAEVDGDTIYNGYYDNALGSAIVIEMARVLSAAPEPRRSVIFLLVTAEEHGLLGSDHFARQPSVPGADLVANVNVDMPLLLHPVADVIVYGVDNSSLGPLARAAAQATGFEVSEDPVPEEVFFVRSDQYSFIRQGIPAIYVDPGRGSLDPDIDGNALIEEFLKTHYHRPSDEVARGVDEDSLERYTRLNAVLAAAVANADERPRWNAGDFFGALFARAPNR